jgi:hypothetical protein
MFDDILSLLESARDISLLVVRYDFSQGVSGFC